MPPADPTDPTVSPDDWGRWGRLSVPILASARHAVGIPARAVVARTTPAAARREAVSLIADSARTEARSFADALTLGRLSLASWRATATDSLAAHSLAAVLAWLDLTGPDDLIPGDGPDDTGAGDREAAGTLIGRLAAGVAKLGDRVAGGDQLLDKSFVGLADDLASVVGEIAAYVGLGREAQPKEGDMGRAASLWKRLAPSWAAGLIEAGDDEK